MSILINREVMAIHAKHPSPRTLSALAHIELAHRHVVILDETDANLFVQLFTPYELKLLYRSITKSEPTSMHLTTLAGHIVGAVAAMAPSTINGFEVEVQARAISDSHQGRFRYAKGSHLPAPQDELFEPAPWPPQAPAIETPAARPTWVPQAPKTPPPVPTPPQAAQSAIKPPWLR